MRARPLLGQLHGCSFLDANGRIASVQESSAASQPMLWLGLDEGVHIDDICLGRMHLTQGQVRELLPMLRRFAKYGDLREGRKRVRR